MKILFLLPEYPALGGVQTVTTQMANYFQAVGHEVSILSLPPGKLYRLPAFSSPRPAGADFPRQSSGADSLRQSPETDSPRQSPCSDSRHSQTLPLEKPLRITLDPGVKQAYLPDSSDYNSKQNLQFIRDYVEQNRIPIIINQGAFSKVYLLFSKHSEHKVINVLRGCPAWEPVRKRKFNTFKNTVLSVRGVGKRIPALLRYLAMKTVPGLATGLARRELFAKIVHAARFVVLAPGYIEELHAAWPGKIAPGQIVAISNPLTGRAKISARKPQIIYAGRLSREDKRIDRLLRIWKLIQDRVPGWSFRIIGEGPEKENLRDYAKKLGLKNLSFESPRVDDSLYAEASIICLSSSYEGYGMVLLEARQAGIVPVAFDCSAGVRDVITHQRNGLLVPAFDEEAFAESLLKLIGDESLRNRLSQQAIEDTRQNDMERIGPLWTALFEELLFQDNILESNNATTELEVLISTYAKPLQPIVDRLPESIEGVSYLISCQGVQDPEPLDFQRKDVSISFTGSTGIAANRNNSIKAARGKIVWLLDDDVLFAQSDLQRILECYEADPGIDLACFQIRTPEGRPYKHYKEQAFRMKSLDDVRDVSSIEITFRLASIRAKGLVFDERFGLGRQWPCSEEFLFLAACLKAGLHIHYFPYPVVEHPYESTIKKMSQYSPVLLEKSGAVNAVLYGRKAYLRNLVSLIKARKAIKNENMSACDFLRIKNRGSRKLLHSNRDERS